MNENGLLDRIHVFGASGSGVTTLAAALASRLGTPHIDADEICWERTDPPYQTRRDLDLRVMLLHEKADRRGRWVLSGSLWNMEIIGSFPFTLVVFLSLNTGERMRRLKAREIARYGHERISPGGDRHEFSCQFLNWAASYDHGGLDMRSRALHEQWLCEIAAPILRLESVVPVDDLVSLVLAAGT